MVSALTDIESHLAWLIGGLTGLTIFLTLYLVSVIDAFRAARRLGQVTLQRYQRIWVYLGVLLIFGGVSQFAFDRTSSHGGCGGDLPAKFTWNYSITNGSMSPALMPGDHVLGIPRYFCRHEPKRGDLAIFLPPGDDDTPAIKRIIGLPGDEIQIRGGVVYINGAAVQREWLQSAIHTDEAGDPRDESEFVETLANGSRYRVTVADSTVPLENTEPFKVPPDHYFVLGDSRDNSLDSRFPSPVGMVPRANIADLPSLIFWSDDRARIGQHVK